MYLFTESYTYKSGVTVSSAGGSDIADHPPEKAIDYNKASYWENDGATPDLIIDLGAIRTIDSLWLKHSNISTFDLYYSDNGSDWTKESETNRIAKSSSVFWQFDFTTRAKRYWKISITAKIGGGNILIYEVMLMLARALWTDTEDLPADVVIIHSDRIGGSYEMADGSAVSFAGQTLYADIDLIFEYLPKTKRDELFTVFSEPVIRSPIVILPDDNYVDGIYRANWSDNSFNFRYTIGYKGSGFSGTIQLQEY